MSPAAAQSLCEGRQSAHTSIRAGPWLGFPSMTQPSHQTQCLWCHEAFRHTTPQIPGNVHTGMSESSRCGGGTRQVPLEKNCTRSQERKSQRVSPPHSIPGRVCFYFRKFIFSPISPRCFSECLAKGKTTHSCQNQPPPVTFATILISHLF